MASQYTKVFADTYPNGWKAKPDLSTPYLTSIKDNEDATFRHIEDYLYNNPIGSGGGGKTYTTTEEEVGTDEDDNTIYSKTVVIEYEPTEYRARGFSVFVDPDVSGKIIIRDYEGTVLFYPGSNDDNFGDCWNIPYFNPESLLFEQDNGEKTQSAMLKSFVYAGSEETIKIPELRLCNYDFDDYPNNTYKYVKFIKVTFFYTKITTE